MSIKSLAEKIFDAFCIQRWNDKIRTVELIEMDKHAHKMIIAYCLGKYEERSGNEICWHNIIRGGIFELLRRIVLSDIKSPIYREIKTKYPDKFIELNKWVFQRLSPLIDDDSIKTDLEKYLVEDNLVDPMSRQILEASHIFSSFWEFQIIKIANPEGTKIAEIDKILHNDLEQFMQLKGMMKIMSKQKIVDFINLCGQLRFQIRWAQTPRLPRTSVLGHMMLVACLSYIFTMRLAPCNKRIYNNFFGALFHDLPEAVTRDIISPVKRAVEGLSEIISEIEVNLAEQEIYGLIEEDWRDEISYFTKDEFSSKVITRRGLKRTSTDTINRMYNEERYSPIDGQLIKVCDQLAAYLEAYVAKKIGITSEHLESGLRMRDDLISANLIIGGINFSSIFSDF